MATTSQYLDIFSDFDTGRSTEAETLLRLDRVKVRGQFRADKSFIGYDYDRQEWIDEPA